MAEPEAAEPDPEQIRQLEESLRAYESGHRFLCLDPEARNLRHTYVVPSEDGTTWRVPQILVDPDAHNDWLAEFSVNLAESRTARAPVLRWVRLGPVAIPA